MSSSKGKPGTEKPKRPRLYHGEGTGKQRAAKSSTSAGGMGPSANPRTLAISRHLKILLPPSSSSSSKLRISEELARHLDRNAIAGGTALVVSPFGSKVWRVEVGRDGNGAFLGRGWPEFVAAHGIGVLWFVVFRHEGSGVLTVKAFDTTFCLHEFIRPINVAGNGSDTAGGYRCRRPQFIKVLLGGFTKKMAIPAEFVRNHITEATTKNRLSIDISLCGNHCRVEVKKDRFGNFFFSGVWSRFLASNGITQGETLLLRYDGNMVFTVKVFGPNGCQKVYKSTNISGLQQTGHNNQMKMKEKQDAPSSSSTGKRKNRNQASSIAEMKRPAISSIPSKKGIAVADACKSFCTYDIGPPAWIRKRINAYSLRNNLRLTPSFCKAIGFQKPCEITLRTTSASNNGTRSWKVRGYAYRCSDMYTHHQLGKGWTFFCRDNGVKEDDICTFNIITATLWYVDIAHHS